jgi:hypothetical protein
MEDTRARAWDPATGEQLTPLLKTRYDLRVPAPDLPRDNRPTADLVLLAQLLCGSRVEETGTLRPLEKHELITAWNILKRKYPEDFAISSPDVLAWHDQEARSCAQAWNWWSALFHLDYLVRAKPNDKAFLQRRDYARTALALANQDTGAYPKRLVYPPRDPLAPAETVDLSTYYNCSLKDPLSLPSLPNGLQIFDGTVFDVRGSIFLAAQKQPGFWSQYPPRVDGVKISRKCQRIHFLHAAGGPRGRKKFDVEVGRYVVHYADHQTNEIRIVYGKDVRDLWTEVDEPLAADNSALVWMGTGPQVQRDTKALRMFKTSWKNPLPDVEVLTIDLVSSVNDTAPFVVAISTE